MRDYDIALKCIKIMKQDGLYRGEEIGSVVKDFSRKNEKYQKGEIVLFRKRKEYCRCCIGQFCSNLFGGLIVESPLSEQEIESEKINHSHNFTKRTIEKVPSRYIERINFLEEMVELS